MKSIAFKLIAVVALAFPAFAKDEHKHAVKEGPNGGRVLSAVEPHLEFLVTKERKVQIIALTDDLKPATLTGQVITVTGGDRAKPTKLQFKEENGKLLSSNALPEGNDYPVSVSIKKDAGGKAVYEKFNLNLENCPTCNHQEYACICDHVQEAKEAKKK
ncbi:MAG: hypothetical protein V4710_09240 [Verrucomicrobiota bacterium]